MLKKEYDVEVGNKIYTLAQKLWPINRSITGNGVRKTLSVIQSIIPDLTIHEVSSGTKVFDWEVPNEWNVNEAWIKDSQGNTVVDFKNNNLHLVGYSTPVDLKISLQELSDRLYSLPEQSEAIPYVTSYYSPWWGFCIKDRQKKKLKEEEYHVYIDSSLKPGSLTYGELLIPGKSEKEIFLSTYICHSSMANNELSGPCVTTYLAKWIQSLEDRNYSYRVVFIPETIGSITYISKNIDVLKERVTAGFNITCVGDDRCYSYLPSRAGSTIADTAAMHVLKHIDPSYKRYSFLERGSDERQYCAPGVDLPVATIMRSKYGEYSEYHTSLDDLENVVTPKGLQGGFEAIKAAISCVEYNLVPDNVHLCEPRLGKRGLRSNLSIAGTCDVHDLMNLIAYSDGTKSLLEIAEIINVPFGKAIELYKILESHSILIEK